MSDDLFRKAPHFWREARPLGLNVGWAQVCFDGVGAGGMLSASRFHEALMLAEPIAKKAQKLRYVVNI